MSDTEMMTAGPSTPAKRGRGRPKKDPSAITKNGGIDGDSITKNGNDDGIPKKRGRKPGVKYAAAAPKAATPSSGRGRGRPKGSKGVKKRAAGKKAGGAGRGRGRPKKRADSVDASQESADDPDQDMDGSAEDDDE